MILGFDNRDKRGPICYECDHQTSPDDCNQIRLCGLNQVQYCDL